MLISLLAWGNRHFAPEGPSVQLIDKKTGAVSDPVLVDRVTGQPITATDHAMAAGPAAPERTRRRYASVRPDGLSATPQGTSTGERAAHKKRAVHEIRAAHKRSRA